MLVKIKYVGEYVKSKENKVIDLEITSEIGELEAVILHSPGPEVENMTPENSQRALYSDILNLSVIKEEYNELCGVLGKITKTFQLKELLENILTNETTKETLIDYIIKNEEVPQLKDFLTKATPKELSGYLIEGVPLRKNNLTRFLSKERFILKPLHNFFYMRDSAVVINNNALIGRMANAVREREAYIIESIFNYYKGFNVTTTNPALLSQDKNISIEGGDILVAREDVLIIGLSARTTSQGIDFIIEQYKKKKEKMNIFVQELPLTPESFIHLDMAFTLVDYDKCVVYEPVIFDPNRYKTIHIQIDNGKVKFINEERDLIEALKKVKIDLKPILCGGTTDLWTQEREQWHSGANFFSVGPGKIVGYNRNTNTLEELNKNGFEIIRAKDIIRNKININDYKKYAITINGSELARGGGGCRCMTMPIKRKKLNL